MYGAQSTMYGARVKRAQNKTYPTHPNTHHTRSGSPSPLTPTPWIMERPKRRSKSPPTAPRPPSPEPSSQPSVIEQPQRQFKNNNEYWMAHNPGFSQNTEIESDDDDETEDKRRPKKLFRSKPKPKPKPKPRASRTKKAATKKAKTKPTKRSKAKSTKPRANPTFWYKDHTRPVKRTGPKWITAQGHFVRRHDTLETQCSSTRPGPGPHLGRDEIREYPTNRRGLTGVRRRHFPSRCYWQKPRRYGVVVEQEF